MAEIHTEIEIKASPKRCWSVLCTFERYPEWNPFLTEMKGTPEIGKPVDLRVKFRWLTVRLHTSVVIAEPGRELRWRGNFLADRLIAGEHYFQFEQIDSQRTRFIHGERFTGGLAPLAWQIIAQEVRQGYARMNQAFKERVESGA